ncbi:Fanconi anemia core complex-associated protein 20 [Meriones unguiculatus]|uniref:Fanconi anemia core complex-associated protein 20 n=1 Tax=Meriones unguiculatus TaxID=10047 RepID=UPI00293E5E1E|nr:Fanconi anemia core complex-associated protein 20 [Meriones unguiculatus]
MARGRADGGRPRRRAGRPDASLPPDAVGRRMEEERRLRGRLSRRRPLAGPGPPNCRPGFLLESSKSEPWVALLRSAVNADLTPNSQPLPPLPAFPIQESQPDPEPTAPPEVFTVGSKTFSWTPFPPALAGSGSSSQPFHGAGGSVGSSTPSLKGCPASDSHQTASTREPVSAQRPPVLLSCPLCQKAFDPKLAQLDVDSHLAQCLAESTEDVAW